MPRGRFQTEGAAGRQVSIGPAEDPCHASGDAAGVRDDANPGVAGQRASHRDVDEPALVHVAVVDARGVGFEPLPIRVRSTPACTSRAAHAPAVP
jgi:hypothetical protein